MTCVRGRLVLSLLLCACVVGAALAEEKAKKQKTSPKKKTEQKTEKKKKSEKQAPTIAVTICNKSKAPAAFVAIGSRAGTLDERKTRLQGWWQIAQGQCQAIGRFPNPGVVYHARTRDGMVWGEKPLASACVDLNVRFDFIWDGEDRPCAANETLVPFHVIVMRPGEGRHTLTLHER